MTLTSWLRNLRSALAPAGVDRKHRRPCSRTFRPCLDALEDRRLPSASVAIGVMGDSLSARYPAGGPDIPGLLWVEQLQSLRSNKITIENHAIAGATSSDLLAQGQHTALAGLAASGAIDYAVLEVGTVDAVFQFAPTTLAGDPTPFVTTVVANVQTALDTVAAAGDVHLVVSNIPDIAVFPFFQFQVGGNPALLQRMTTAVAMANQQIEAFAAARDIPVIDLFALSHLTLGPVPVGGVQVTNILNPDGLHPNTVGQGLLANTILEALHKAGELKTKHLRLSDQEILDLAGIRHPTHGPQTYFDVSSFVLSGSSDVDSRSSDTIQASWAVATLTDPVTKKRFGDLVVSMFAHGSNRFPFTQNLFSAALFTLQECGTATNTISSTVQTESVGSVRPPAEATTSDKF